MSDVQAKHQKTDTVETDKVRPSSKDQAAKGSKQDAKVEQLEAQLKQAQDSLLRSQADYQNLQRRTQEEKTKWLKMATRDLVEALLQPLDHLSLAAQQLKDPGLNMTITQFWQTLKEHGVEEIDPVGQEFDVNKMEAVERQGEGQTVLSVVKRGYTLNGEVLQHAKVVVGDKK